MTETGWIIVILIAVVAIVLAILILRRKGPADALAAEPVAEDLLPEQVVLPVTEPEPGTSFPQPPLASIIPPVAEPPAAIPAEKSAAPTPATVSTAAAEPSVPPPTPEPISVADGDNLLRLKGVGPRIATLLRQEGITRYAQIADWTATDIAAIDAKLGSFAGRPTRDHWVDQARLLATGDIAAYEAKYGKL